MCVQVNQHQGRGVRTQKGSWKQPLLSTLRGGITLTPPHPTPTQRRDGLCSLSLGSLPPHSSPVCLCSAVPSLDLPAWAFLQRGHLTLRTLSSYLSEKLPLTKLPAGNFSQHFTDPKATHDFDFYISQMDDQLLEGEHKASLSILQSALALKQCQDCGYSS